MIRLLKKALLKSSVSTPIRTESLMSSRTNIAGNGGQTVLNFSDGTLLNCNTIIRCWNESKVTVTKLRPIFMNWLTSNNGEQAATNAITVEGSFEYPIGSTPQRFKFSGNNIGNFAIDETPVGDEITLTTPLPPDAQFALRAYVVVPSGQKFPMMTVADTTNGEACDFNTGVSKVDGGTITDNSSAGPPQVRRGYAPVGIKATAWSSGTITPIAIAGVGDSNISGAVPRTARRGNSGAFGRGLAGVAPFMNCGIFAGDAFENTQTGFARRLDLWQKCAVTHVWCNFGGNDTTFGRTTSVITTALNTIYTTIKNAGFKVIANTITPRVKANGTTCLVDVDAYLKESFMIPMDTPTSTTYAGGLSSTRGQVNTWIKSKPTGVDYVFNTNLYVETDEANSSCIWKTGESASPPYVQGQVPTGKLQPPIFGTIDGTSTPTVLDTNVGPYPTGFTTYMSTGNGFIFFTSGANAGQYRTIASTTQSGGITLDSALPSAPLVGDTFILYPYQGAMTTDRVHMSVGSDTYAGQEVVAVQIPNFVASLAA